jgi:DNA-directed RNA polymerase subunit RPC12/RpoP
LAVQFACSECGKTLSVKDELAGKRVKCSCGAVVLARPAARRPTASKTTSENQAAATDLGSMFDELTESDMRTQASRDQEAAEAHAAIKDPLADYSNQPSGKAKRPRAPGSLPVGWTVLAVFSALTAVSGLGNGLVLIFAPQLLEPLAETLPAIKTQKTMLTVIVLVIGTLSALVAVALLTPNPLRKRLARS